MKRTWLNALIVLGLIAAPAVPAMAAERLNDKAVEQQGRQIKDGFNSWKKALEKQNMADAVIRSAAGTIDVKEYLKAFEKDIDAFNDRFKNSKSAVPEALALLRRASDVERRFRQQGGAAPSEWAALSRQFAALCGAYGAAWPIEAMDATLGRLNDKELAAQAEDMGRLAKRIKGPADDAAKTAPGIDKAGRETIKLELDSVARLGGEVANRIKGGQPASVQVSQLLAVTFSVGGKLASLNLSQTAKSDWSVVDQAAAAVARAFGEQWSGK